MTRLTYAESILTAEDYQYLPPSVLPLLEYEEEIAADANYLTYDWAHNEIVQHSLNWVRVGLVAHRMQYLKLWKGKFKNFREYCENALGKKCFQIKNLIRASEVMLTLAREGFKTLPSCQSQVESLIRCCKKLDEDFSTGWLDAWSKVTEALEPKMITSKSISAALVFPPENSNVVIPHDLHDRIAQTAREEGIGFLEALEKAFPKTESSEEINQEAGELAEDETEAVKPQMIELWEIDLPQLIQERDRQSWLNATLIKLAGLAQKVSSQFSFLVDHKLQLA